MENWIKLKIDPLVPQRPSMPSTDICWTCCWPLDLPAGPFEDSTKRFRSPAINHRRASYATCDVDGNGRRNSNQV
jgi:hypothetical protein